MKKWFIVLGALAAIAVIVNKLRKMERRRPMVEDFEI